ncbi:hypothetical protein GEMRC1_006026 [Eukaryota sp. GEM-RC1]
MEIIDDSIDYISANNIRATSLGSAIGVLTFNVGSVANQIHNRHSLPVIPGTGTLLIGRDLQNDLGLLKDDGLIIRLDKEHRTILNSEREFDERISIPSKPILDQSISIASINDECGKSQPSNQSLIDFEKKVDDSGCKILLDDPTRRQALLTLLSE